MPALLVMGDMPLSSLVRGHRQRGIRLHWNFRKSYFVSIVKKTRLTPGRNGPADGLVQYLTCVTAQRSSLVIRATTIPMRLIVSCHPPRDSGFQASLRQISGVAGKKPTDLRSVCRWRYFVGFLRSRLREKCAHDVRSNLSAQRVNIDTSDGGNTRRWWRRCRRAWIENHSGCVSAGKR